MKRMLWVRGIWVSDGRVEEEERGREQRAYRLASGASLVERDILEEDAG
jgi:hypothetical protein